MFLLFQKFFLFFLVVSSVFAADQLPCKVFLLPESGSEKFALDVGKPALLQLKPEDSAVRATFVGRLIRANWGFKDLQFLHEGDSESLMHIVAANRTDIFASSAGDAPKVEPAQTCPVVRAISQEGPKCAAFSILNAFRLMHTRGFLGNKLFGERMAEEEDRIKLFTRINVEFYEDGDHRGAIEELSAEHGFKAFEISAKTPEAFQAEVIKYLQMGWPVFLSFQVPAVMSQNIRILDHSDGTEYDNRLWLPTAQGEPTKGARHLVFASNVIAGEKGKQYLVISDPNWRAPRLWGIEQLLKYYSGSMNAWVLWEILNQVH